MRSPLNHVSQAFVLGLSALLLAGGCGKSGPTAPPGALPTLTLRQTLNAAVPSTVTVPTNLDTTASVLLTLHLGGPVKAAAGAFMNGQLVDAGKVWIRAFQLGGALDSVELVQTSGVIGGHMIVVYGTPTATVNLTFDGNAFHVFRVAGSTSIPAFVDSMKSVDDLGLASPVGDTTVTRSTGLPVYWNDAGSDIDVKVTATVIASSDTTLKAAGTLAADLDGTAFIPAVELNRLPAGPAKLAVTRYRLLYKMSGGRLTGFLCETVEVKNLTLN